MSMCNKVHRSHHTGVARGCTGCTCTQGWENKIYVV